MKFTPTVGKMGAERLDRLARHLWNGAGGHTRFDFKIWSRGPRKKNGCGSSGCAFGECLLLWPEEFTSSQIDFGRYYRVVHKATGSAGLWAASEFFQIPKPVAMHLFTPFGYRREFGGKPYSPKTPTTPRQVAIKIRAFLKVAKFVAL